MPLSLIEQRWLDYCWSVLTDRDHIQQCEQAGGAGLEDKSLRWPGYLGSAYKPGGLLLVANIHRDFASGQAVSALASNLVSTAKSWRDGGRSDKSDRQYLSAIQLCYFQGLSQWKVGKWFAKYLAKSGESFEQIAYVNAARCQARRGTCPELQRLCLARFPLDDLAAFLKPRLILTCSTIVRDSDMGKTSIRWFHQLYGTDRQRRAFSDWSQEDL